MRRLLATFVLSSLLVVSLSSVSLVSRVSAQRKPAKAAPVSIASQRGVDTISAAQMKDYLSFIASDAMEGRDTPSRGLDMTAQFLAMNLSRWGFRPAGDDGTYFQKIALSRDVLDKAETHVLLNGQTLVLGDDYIPFARPADLPATQLVFAGNGWLVKSKGIDAYKGIDAKGKIAVIFGSPNGIPVGLRNSDLTGKRGEDWMNTAEYAQKQGVAAIVFVPDFQYLANWDRNRARITERGITKVDKFQPAVGTQMPQLVVSPRIATSLFQGETPASNQTQEAEGGSRQELSSAIFESAYKGKLFEPFALSPGKKLSITVKVKSEPLATQNVVAVFEGSDPVLKNEYVALGAHYDHVGWAYL